MKLGSIDFALDFPLMNKDVPHKLGHQLALLLTPLFFPSFSIFDETFELIEDELPWFSWEERIKKLNVLSFLG